LSGDRDTDSRTVQVKGATPLVLLNLAMTAAENDTDDVSDDETNELDQITSELERNEYIGENNAVNFSLNGLKDEDDTTTDTDTEGNSEQSETKNMSDDTDAIDASINEMTVDINTVKESPLSVDHVALMLNSESPPPVFLRIHIIFSIILLKLYL